MKPMVIDQKNWKQKNSLKIIGTSLKIIGPFKTIGKSLKVIGHRKMPFKKRVAPAMWRGGQTRPNLDLSRPSGKLKSFRPTHPEVDQFSGEKRNIM